MKNKIKITLFVFLIISILGFSFIYKEKNNKPKRKKHNSLAIMIKGEENGEYIKSNSKDIPKGNYTLNYEKSYCKNNGKIGNYDSVLGKISFSFIGSDSCFLFFDLIIDSEKPVISNLKINGKTISAILTDNEGLYAYGFSTSNTSTPTYWNMISGKSFNLSTTLSSEGTYYLWVKDTARNMAVSDVIDLEKKGWQTILANSTVNSTTPDFSTVATTNEGVYAAEDDLGTSYYFRGAVDNNWVKFGKDSTGNDIYWRIIRINGDGSIRMIYTGTTAPTSSTSVKMTGTGTRIGTGKYNTNYNSSVYVGYMFSIGEQHGNSTSSTIKTAVDNWYKTTTLEKDALTKKLVADQIFCNDRSVSSGTWTSSSYVDYSPYTRLVTNKTPILTCPTASDKFTVNATNGNGALTYPVGLITIDELAMAGGVNGTDNTSYYLYINQTYLTGSPSDYNKSHSSVFEVYSVGYLQGSYVDYIDGIRPVISLSSTVKLSGNGTWNNVYEVVN